MTHPRRFRTALAVEQLERREVPAGLVYGHDSSGRLFAIDLWSGFNTVVGDTGLRLTDIAFDGVGRLYGVTGTGGLYAINPNTARTFKVGEVEPGLNALEFGPDGLLYGATANGVKGSELVKINLATGRVTTVGVMEGYWSAGDLAFGPNGQLLMSTTSSDLVRVNVRTTEVKKLGSLPFDDVNGLALAEDGFLYGLASSARSVYRINPTTGQSTWVGHLGFFVNGASGAAAVASSRRTFVFLFPGSEDDAGLKKLEQRILDEYGDVVATEVIPWQGGSGMAPVRLARRELTDFLRDAGAGPNDKVVLIGHGYGGHLARLLASDVRNGSLKPQAAHTLITLDPIDWDRPRRKDQSDLVYSRPKGVPGSQILNIVQRRRGERYQGYRIAGADNDAKLAKGRDGRYARRGRPSPDDTTHNLIDDNLGRNGTSLRVYRHILQKLDLALRAV